MISSLLFLLTGQQTPAFGRRVSGVIEIADGSRRRKAAALTEVIIVFWLASWMMSRWLHYPDWVTIIAQQVLMNVVSVMQADCRMNLLEIFLRWLMRKIFHVRLLPAVSTQPNCLNQLLLFFSHPGELSARSGDALQKAFTDKEELLKQQASNLHEQKKLG